MNKYYYFLNNTIQYSIQKDCYNHDSTAKFAIPEYYFELWPGYIATKYQHERLL